MQVGGDGEKKNDDNDNDWDWKLLLIDFRLTLQTTMALEATEIVLGA